MIKYIFLMGLTVHTLYSLEPNTITRIAQDLSPATFSGPYSVAVAPDGLTAYVPNFNGDSVSIIDVATQKVTGTVNDPEATFSNPIDIVITPNGATAYVVNSNSSVSYINLTTYTAGLVLDTGSTFNNCIGIAAAPDGASVYVTNENADSISIITVASNTVSNPAITSGLLDEPTALAIAPDGTKAYVINRGNNTIAMIDLLSNSVTGTVNLNGFTLDVPISIIFTPNGQMAYLSNLAGQNVLLIDAGSDMVVEMVADPQALFVNGPQELAILPDGRTVYVTANNNLVLVIDVATNTVTGMVADPQQTLDGPIAVAITPNGVMGYIPNYHGNSVSIMVAGPGAPSTVSGCKTQNVFLFETDLINHISWTAPISGDMPVAYTIYRDLALTDVVATVSTAGPLQYYDHNREPGITYSYYIVSLDQDGNVSQANSVTVTDPC